MQPALNSLKGDSPSERRVAFPLALVCMLLRPETASCWPHSQFCWFPQGPRKGGQGCSCACFGDFGKNWVHASIVYVCALVCGRVPMWCVHACVDVCVWCVSVCMSLRVCVHVRAEKGRVADAGSPRAPSPMAARPGQLHVEPVVTHAGAVPLAAAVPAPVQLALGLRALHVHASSCGQRTQA